MSLDSKATQELPSQELEKNSIVDNPKKTYKEIIQMECITKCKNGWRVRKTVNFTEFDVFFKTLKPAKNFRDKLNNLQVNRPGTNEYKKAYDESKGEINIFWGDVVAAYLKFTKASKSNGTFVTYSKRCLKYLIPLKDKDFRKINRDEIISLINAGTTIGVKARIAGLIDQVSEYCKESEKWKDYIESAPWDSLEYRAIVKRIAPSDTGNDEVSNEKEISGEPEINKNGEIVGPSNDEKLMSFAMKSLNMFLNGEIKVQTRKAGATISSTLFILLGRLAGLRPGESSVLYWSDINFKECYIRVWCNKTELDGIWIRQEGITKSGTGKERNVKISKRFRDILKAVYEKRDPTNPFVCNSSNNVPVNSTVRDAFKTFLRYAGIKEHHTPHNLRTTFATNFLRTNNTATGLLTLSNLLGHKSLETTKKYVVLIKSDKSKAIEINTDNALNLAEESFELPSIDQTQPKG